MKGLRTLWRQFAFNHWRGPYARLLRGSSDPWEPNSYQRRKRRKALIADYREACNHEIEWTTGLYGSVCRGLERTD